MSYTNSDLVKKHIDLGGASSGLRQDYPATFSGLDWVQLPGGSIIDGSVAVKAVKDTAPTLESVTLGDAEVGLIHQKIVPYSATVASDSSLGIVYAENADYALDSARGRITRLLDGTIPEGETVAVWYYFYSPYVEGTDYSVNYSEGLVRRLSNGAILPGQTVLIDYELCSGRLGDEIIAAAADEANAVMEKSVDPAGTFGADLTLQTAATYLAVSLVCRIAAANELKTSAAGGQATRSGAWLALAESYRRDFEELVKNFRPPAARMNRPRRS